VNKGKKKGLGCYTPAFAGTPKQALFGGKQAERVRVR
jgi:hypothetical protein